MKLVHYRMTPQFELDRGNINVMVLENPKYRYDLIHELALQCAGYAGQFVLSHDDKKLDIHKHMDIVYSPFTMDFNSKSVLTKIYNNLKINAVDTTYYEETQDIYRAIYEYIGKLISSENLPLTYDTTVDVVSILKAAGVCIDIDEDTKLSHKVLEYCRILRNLCVAKVFVFVDFKSYMSTDDLTLLYESIIYEQLHVLFIESVQMAKLPYESLYIVDKDLCEIY